jgi:hypothetical protein
VCRRRDAVAAVWRASSRRFGSELVFPFRGDRAGRTAGTQLGPHPRRTRRGWQASPDVRRRAGAARLTPRHTEHGPTRSNRGARQPAARGRRCPRSASASTPRFAAARSPGRVRGAPRSWFSFSRRRHAVVARNVVVGRFRRSWLLMAVAVGDSGRSLSRVAVAWAAAGLVSRRPGGCGRRGEGLPRGARMAATRVRARHRAAASGRSAARGWWGRRWAGFGSVHVGAVAGAARVADLGDRLAALHPVARGDPGASLFEVGEHDVAPVSEVEDEVVAFHAAGRGEARGAADRGAARTRAARVGPVHQRTGTSTSGSPSSSAAKASGSSPTRSAATNPSRPKYARSGLSLPTVPAGVGGPGQGGNSQCAARIRHGGPQRREGPADETGVLALDSRGRYVHAACKQPPREGRGVAEE